MVKLYVLSGARVQSSSSLALHCDDCMVVLGTLIGEALMGKQMKYLQTVIRTRIVEVDRDFQDIAPLSLLLQPSELVAQVDRMSACCWKQCMVLCEHH